MTPPPADIPDIADPSTFAVRAQAWVAWQKIWYAELETIIGTTIPAGSAAAGTLTGNTIAANVTASSLTSVGTLTALNVSGTSTLGVVNGGGLLTLNKGGTGDHQVSGFTVKSYLSENGSTFGLTTATAQGGGGFRASATTVDLLISGSSVLSAVASGVSTPGTLNATGAASAASLVCTGGAHVGGALNSGIQCYITGTGTKIHFLVDGTNGQPIYSGTNSQTFSAGESATASALFLRKDGTSGRSLSSAGTNNASGADYAEYEYKASGCGTVAKAQIIGLDANGRVTDKWADSVSFGVKSSNPGMVGGDVWGSDDSLGLPKPWEPNYDPPKYDGPAAAVALPEDASEEDKAANAEAAKAFGAAQTAWQQSVSIYNVNHQANLAQHELDVERFNARLETARQAVDRISYCGKVPVNVLGAKVGDYIIPAKDGAGINGIAATSPTFDQYRIVVGQVRRIIDTEYSAKLAGLCNMADLAYFVGMAEIAVKVG